MISYDKNELQSAAGKYGFVRDTFEKVLRLTEVLRRIDEDPFLKEHLVLKGGTAINLALMDLPRLSVDIDMDFVPNCGKEEMLTLRTEIRNRLEKIMAVDGYAFLPASRTSLSLDSMRFAYTKAGGGPDLIKVEINYSLRSHVFECVRKAIDFEFLPSPVRITVVDPIEIYSSKLNALLNRVAPRDLYDVASMINLRFFGEDKRDRLRKCTVFYACIGEENIDPTFDTSKVGELNFPRIRRELFPVLRNTNLAGFELDARIESAKRYITDLMVLTRDEEEFMNRFMKGEYMPELLFEEEQILSRIRNHPMAIWKCRKL